MFPPPKLRFSIGVERSFSEITPTLSGDNGDCHDCDNRSTSLNKIKYEAIVDEIVETLFTDQDDDLGKSRSTMFVS